MPRASKTEFAILGLLSLRPMSGYDIKTFIAQSIGFFWQESYGQLYPTLRRLVASGLSTESSQTTGGRPERRVYKITKAGRAQLLAWLKTPTESEPIRNELLLKLFFGMFTDRSTCAEHVRSLLEQQTERLREFNYVERTILKEYERQDVYDYWITTLRFGRHITRARVRWCRQTLAWLKDQPRSKKK
ncbi:MAG: PadR family transcriptional regulator [Candidatus Zixiibacteriota bacterium]